MKIINFAKPNFDLDFELLSISADESSLKIIGLQEVGTDTIAVLFMRMASLSPNITELDLAHSNIAKEHLFQNYQYLSLTNISTLTLSSSMSLSEHIGMCQEK